MSGPTFNPIQRDRFDEVRATQAAAWLVKKSPDGISDCVFGLLLYLSDREMLSRFGYPITTDRYEIENGVPVPMNIRNLLSGGSGQESFWSRHLILQHGVRLRHDPGHDHLSKAIENVLDIVFRVHGSMADDKSLFHYVTGLPECRKPDHTPLDYRRILEAVGRSPEDIELIASETENLNAAEALFSPKG